VDRIGSKLAIMGGQIDVVAACSLWFFQFGMFSTYNREKSSLHAKNPPIKLLTGT